MHADGELWRRLVDVPATLLRRGRGSAVVHSAFWPAAADAPADAPIQVCLHGLGGSHVNWLLLGPRLAAHGPVWAPDLAGFGFTAPDTRSASVEDNIDLVAGFLAVVAGDRPVVLLGNSMGGHIAYSIAAGGRHRVAGLVLIGPAVPPMVKVPDRDVVRRFAMYATPVLGRAVLERRRRLLTPAEEVAEVMQLCMADASRLDARALEAHIAMAAQRRRMPHVPKAFLTAARSLLARIGPQRAELWRGIDRIDAPGLILHGSFDRLIEEPACDRLAARRPDWRYIVYPDLGHVVMLEDPERVAFDIGAWRADALDGVRPGG